MVKEVKGRERKKARRTQGHRDSNIEGGKRGFIEFASFPCPSLRVGLNK